MRCEDQIVFARVDQDVVYRNVRQVFQVQREPVLAARVRRKQPQLSACVKQIGILRILAHDLDISFRRQVAGNVRPRFAALSCLEDVRPEVVKHVTFKSHVCSVGVGP